MTDSDDLDTLRALSEKATPGPWEARTPGMDALVVRPDGSHINAGDAIYHPRFEADAALIAAAVNYVRKLLANR